MELFFNDLNNRIQLAIKKDIARIFNEVGNEQIYTIALVTDSDCITLYLALNTYEYMQKKDEQYIKMFQGRLPEERIKSIRDGLSSFTKWIPAEWGYSDGKNSELNKISKLLYEKEEMAPEEYAKSRALFFDAVTAAFKQLIEEKVFGENTEKITYYVSMSDGEGTTEIENHSAELLNSESVYKQFLKRLEN